MKNYKNKTNKNKITLIIYNRSLSKNKTIHP